jgi:hypothetical protein
MDTTAFIRKIHGEVSRIKPAQMPVISAQSQTTFNKKPKPDAGKSTKTGCAKESAPVVYRNILRAD